MNDGGDDDVENNNTDEVYQYIEDWNEHTVEVDQHIVQENENTNLDDTVEAYEAPEKIFKSRTNINIWITHRKHMNLLQNKLMKWKQMNLLQSKSVKMSSYIQVSVTMIYLNRSR